MRIYLAYIIAIWGKKSTPQMGGHEKKNQNVADTKKRKDPRRGMIRHTTDCQTAPVDRCLLLLLLERHPIIPHGGMMMMSRAEPVIRLLQYSTGTVQS